MMRLFVAAKQFQSLFHNVVQYVQIILVFNAHTPDIPCPSNIYRCLVHMAPLVACYLKFILLPSCSALWGVYNYVTIVSLCNLS